MHNGASTCPRRRFACGRRSQVWTAVLGNSCCLCPPCTCLHISGKIVLTNLAITLLDQAEIECQRLEPRITREVLTGILLYVPKTAALIRYRAAIPATPLGLCRPDGRLRAGQHDPAPLSIQEGQGIPVRRCDLAGSNSGAPLPAMDRALRQILLSLSPLCLP
jgi:hypothetical protein